MYNQFDVNEPERDSKASRDFFAGYEYSESKPTHLIRFQILATCIVVLS